LAINSEGEIAGYYDDARLSSHGFLRKSNGTIVSIDVPSSLRTVPTAINSSGWMAGNYFDATGIHGFVRKRNGAIIRFDPPGSNGTFPQALNSDGEITGDYGSSSGASGVHGFLRKRDGAIILFDPPGSSSTLALAINSEGEIAGYYFEGRSSHGFVRSGCESDDDCERQSERPEDFEGDGREEGHLRLH
jgi:hypothetical protein